jgi:hypothetical protein
MTLRRILIVCLAVSLLLAGVAVFAQVSRPWRNGSVWDVAFIRVKPGMDEAYRNYLVNEWKAHNEAAKKEGLLLSYKVLSTEAHDTSDWNLILMTEYKNLATMEANEPKEDALAQKTIGTDQKQQQGYEDRSKIREIVGGRLAREIVLEPRQ